MLLQQEQGDANDYCITVRVKSKFFPWFRVSQQKRNPLTVRNACHACQEMEGYFMGIRVSL